jgi:hypothetical protein
VGEVNALIRGGVGELYLLNQSVVEISDSETNKYDRDDDRDAMILHDAFCWYTGKGWDRWV